MHILTNLFMAASALVPFGASMPAPLAPAQANVTSPANTDCREALTKRARGFFPYCSPIRTPRFGHTFSIEEAVAAQKSFMAEWREEGGLKVPKRASRAEVELTLSIHKYDRSATRSRCLGEGLTECIAYLSKQFLVTTNATKPMLPLLSAGSFEPQPQSNLVELQIVLPAVLEINGSQSLQTSSLKRVVGLSLFVKNERVTSIEISGFYPILSSDPGDYAGTGFAAFMATVFPECDAADEMTFYRSVWTNLVRPASPASDNGKWKFTDSGIAKSYVSLGDGTLCGLKASAMRGVSRGITFEGRPSGWAATVLRIAL